MRDLREALPWTDKLVAKLRNPEYRNSYVTEGVKTWIARQVRALREQRGWSQGDLGRETGKPQSAISRIEDPDYGKLSLQTLFDLAAAFNVALVVKFVDYPTFLRETKDISTGSLHVESFDESSFSSASSFSTMLVGVNTSNLNWLSSISDSQIFVEQNVATDQDLGTIRIGAFASAGSQSMASLLQ
jgi:transcriptional regulator with XRE-family HTH domain